MGNAQEDIFASGSTVAEPANEFESNALRIARMIFDINGTLDRVALIELPTGLEVTALPVPPPENHYLANRIMKVFSDGLAERKAIGVAILCEAWTVTTTAEEMRSLPVSLADADARREVLVVAVEHLSLEGGTPRTWTAPIKRDEGGRGTVGEWRLMGGDGVMSGRMIGILPRQAGDALTTSH